jgi:hypothetical protein
VKGRPRLLHYSDVDYLKRLIRHHPDWFLDELQYLLQTNRFITAHFTTIHRELVRAGISSKKIKKTASERNENLRADYIGRMAQYSPEQLGFLDEISGQVAALLHFLQLWTWRKTSLGLSFELALAAAGMMKPQVNAQSCVYKCKLQ